MKIPSWFLLGCGLLVLNAFAVLGGALMRHAVAEPPIQVPINEVSDSPSATASPDQSKQVLPEVPSLEELPLATSSNAPSILGVEDFKRVFAEQSPGIDLPTPMAEIPMNSTSVISEQLSQSYFEALQLRLKSATHLSQAAQGLVAEAKILFQRGEVREAKDLLGTATQLREMAAKLLVTRQ